MKPGFGEASQGAVAGATVAGIGGLFAVGIARAILGHDPALLFGMPLLNLLCWMVSLPIGWLVGGQIGPRLGYRLKSERAELIGGVLGGLAPVLAIALWGWYMVAPG